MVKIIKGTEVACPVAHVRTPLAKTKDTTSNVSTAETDVHVQPQPGPLGSRTRQGDRLQDYVEGSFPDTDEEQELLALQDKDIANENEENAKTSSKEKVHPKKHKLSLVEMACKDHKAYQIFMTKKVPKMLAALGGDDSSDTSSSD